MKAKSNYIDGIAALVSIQFVQSIDTYRIDSYLKN